MALSGGPGVNQYLMGGPSQPFRTGGGFAGMRSPNSMATGTKQMVISNQLQMRNRQIQQQRSPKKGGRVN